MVERVMDQIRLKQIYDNINLIDSDDIIQINKIIETYPYYNLPYIILAKYYYRLNNDKHIDYLKQASIRVQDRKLLYHYIHEITHIKNESKDIIEEERELDLDIVDQHPITNENPILESVLEKKANDNHEKLTINESKPVTTEIQTTTDVNDFLKDFNQEEAILTDEIVEFNQIENKDTQVLEMDNENTLIETLEQTIVSSADEHEIEFTINSNDFKSIENIESEVTESETNNLVDDYQDDFVLSNPIETKTETEISELLELRKNPIYSIEHALDNKSKTETPKDEPISSEMDFFEWLKHPENNTRINHQLEEDNSPELEEEPFERHQSMDLIEKFITVSPQISRPKKEFFSAENMAKKSEVLELDFVSETLAKLYVENGSFDLAIKVYEKLSLQNPSKKPYFASLIKKIKKENK